MVLDAVSNFVRGESDAAIDDTQTTVSVVDASIFPDPATDGEYNVVIWDAQNHPRPDQDPDVEILRVTAIDTGTNDLTVTRAQETTTAASHPSGSAIHLSPTAKMFGDIENTFADFWDASAQELTADVNNQSVSTDESYTEYQPNSGLTSMAPEITGGRKEPIYPTFTRSSNNPILTPSDLSWSVSSGEIHFPSVIRTTELSNPLGEFYLYYAPHNSDGVGVAYADDPEGPWTDYSNNPIINDTGARESGTIIRPDAGEVWLYTNMSNNPINLYRSPNGLDNWTDDGAVTDLQGVHAGYWRPIRRPNGTYAASWLKLADGKSQNVLRYSPDGTQSWIWEPVTWRGEAPTGTDDDDGVFYHDGANLLPWHNGYIAFWSVQDKPANQWDVKWGWTNDGVEIDEWGTLLTGGGQSWENSRVAEPEPLFYDDTLYLFYAGKDVGSQQIGVAVADFSEVIA